MDTALLKRPSSDTWERSQRSAALIRLARGSPRLSAWHLRRPWTRPTTLLKLSAGLGQDQGEVPGRVRVATAHLEARPPHPPPPPPRSPPPPPPPPTPPRMPRLPRSRISIPSCRSSYSATCSNAS